MATLMRWTMVSVLALIVSLAGGPSAGAESTPEGVPDDVLGLADMRGALAAEINALKVDIAELEQTPAGERMLRVDKERLQKEVEHLSKRSAPTSQEQQELGDLRLKLATINAELSQYDQRAKKLEEKRRLLLEKQSRAAAVHAKIVRMQTPEQSFKLYASGIFAGLIGVVIVGFFVVLGRDRSILVAIFSGEFGLQFLTLFSLVIAIILFGILGILEGRELSALLGGISGYILGRTAAAVKAPKEEGKNIASGGVPGSGVGSG